MTKYFLGVDVGGTKTHALIATEKGMAVGFGRGGPGNWEGVGYEGLTAALQQAAGQALKNAGITVDQIAGAGMGIGGYDWRSEKPQHLKAIQPLGLNCPFEIVNDATLGILAGASEGWGVSVVSGTGCNARGWSRDHKREGRAVGGGEWSGEFGGGMDLVTRAMQAVAFEWVKRGPKTALSQAFMQHFKVNSLEELVEGVYMNRLKFDQSLVLLVFEVAKAGDPEALNVIRWAGDQLGQMAIGVINQLEIQNEDFEVVLIGSVYDGSPLLTESLSLTVRHVAPKARFIRLTVPPVVGGVLLGMEEAGLQGHAVRQQLIESTKAILKK